MSTHPDFQLMEELARQEYRRNLDAIRQLRKLYSAKHKAERSERTETHPRLAGRESRTGMFTPVPVGRTNIGESVSLIKKGDFAGTVREILRLKTGRFTAKDILADLKRSRPLVGNQASFNAVTTVIRRSPHLGIEIVTPGSPGNPTVYEKRAVSKNLG